MKKTLFAVALAAAGLATVPAVFAQDTSAPTAQQGWYVDAEVGYGQINNGAYDANGDAVGGLKGGYRFALNPQFSAGVEAGYQYLGSMDAYTGNPAQRSKLHGPTLGANLRYNFTPDWYAEVRAGAFYAQGQGVVENASLSYQRFERTSYYTGLGLGYNINQHLSAGVNYNYYDGSNHNHGAQLQTNAYTAQVEYRF